MVRFDLATLPQWATDAQAWSHRNLRPASRVLQRKCKTWLRRNAKLRSSTALHCTPPLPPESKILGFDLFCVVEPELAGRLQPDRLFRRLSRWQQPLSGASGLEARRCSLGPLGVPTASSCSIRSQATSYVSMTGATWEQERTVEGSEGTQPFCRSVRQNSAGSVTSLSLTSTDADLVNLRPGFVDTLHRIIRGKRLSDFVHLPSRHAASASSLSRAQGTRRLLRLPCLLPRRLVPRHRQDREN